MRVPWVALVVVLDMRDKFEVLSLKVVWSPLLREIRCRSNNRVIRLEVNQVTLRVVVDIMVEGRMVLGRLKITAVLGRMVVQMAGTPVMVAFRVAEVIFLVVHLLVLAAAYLMVSMEEAFLGDFLEVFLVEDGRGEVDRVEAAIQVLQEEVVRVVVEIQA